MSNSSCRYRCLSVGLEPADMVSVVVFVALLMGLSLLPRVVEGYANNVPKAQRSQGPWQARPVI